MKKEEKELLLIDLSVRIPYGVICHTYIGDFKLLGIDDEVLVHLDSPGGYFYFEHNITPYLRPMSSMTDEERIYKENYFKYDFLSWDYVDWLNSHHFDYRGLIEKGLALEAPDGMYKINK